MTDSNRRHPPCKREQGDFRNPGGDLEFEHNRLSPRSQQVSPGCTASHSEAHGCKRTPNDSALPLTPFRDSGVDDRFAGKTFWFSTKWFVYELLPDLTSCEGTAPSWTSLSLG